MKCQIVLLSTLLSLTLSSCGGGSEKSAPQRPLAVERIDRYISAHDELSDSMRMVYNDSMHDGLSVYLAMLRYPVDSIGVDASIDNLSQAGFIKIFTPDVESRLVDLTDVERSLGEVSSNLAKLLPAARLSDVYGIVSPFRQGVITSDSIALVALNLYLGPDYPGYAGFEDYFKESRIASRIPYDVAEGVIAANYPMAQSDSPTLLSNMIYHGALVYAVKNIVPDANLAMAIGVSDEDLSWLQWHEKDIWAALMDNEMVYSTSEMDFAKLLSSGPKSDWLLTAMPARAGRYIGYKIVEIYVKTHGGVTLEELLSPGFYASPQSLIDSKYRP